MLPYRKIKNIENLNAFKRQVESNKILTQIKTKMQLNSIRLEDLECLQCFIFDAKEKNIVPLFLTQIKDVFRGLDKITSQEIKEYYYICENKIIAKYLLQIWNEMFERQVQILIF